MWQPKEGLRFKTRSWAPPQQMQQRSAQMRKTIARLVSTAAEIARSDRLSGRSQGKTDPTKGSGLVFFRINMANIMGQRN